jgi:hypothetical protein
MPNLSMMLPRGIIARTTTKRAGYHFLLPTAVSAAPIRTPNALYHHLKRERTTQLLQTQQQQQQQQSVFDFQRRFFCSGGSSSSSSNPSSASNSNHSSSNSADPPTNKESTTSTSTFTITTTTTRRLSLSRRLRRGVGDLFSAAGFISSSLVSIVRNPRRVWDQTQQPLRAFRNFLETSGIDVELEQVLGMGKGKVGLLSMALLGRVHANLYFDTKQHTEEAKTTSNPHPSSSCTPEFWDRARRYMRYATAVYGQDMIRAATVDARGARFRDVAETVGQATLPAISNHIGVPTKDLLWVEVDFDYGPGPDDEFLRHLVAIDHAHKEVVLAIRGTFSVQEIVVDIASYSRDGFCGGEAHEGMATMAERLWQVVGPTIVDTLHDHPDFDLVVTGHSLGAGTASLLTILLKQQQLQQQRNQKLPIGHDITTSNPPLLPPSTALRCFAYASPPVFTPLQVIPQATQVITNFIHEYDVVPFLSVYSVRYLLASLKAIQSVSSELSWTQKLAIVGGSQPPPDDMIQAVLNTPSLLPKRGAPRLQVPASQTIWLQQQSKGEYVPAIYDSKDFPFIHIRVNPNMVVDHFPARYEYALEHLDENGNCSDDSDDE